mmetsp:Transcript_28579/g.77378  ORF Transcript_28579/g.77378 Transcript_28579/m.77378 type:complete len:96 (-) Transcript_28579:876-1163(-)
MATPRGMQIVADGEEAEVHGGMILGEWSHLLQEEEAGDDTEHVEEEEEFHNLDVDWTSDVVAVGFLQRVVDLVRRTSDVVLDSFASFRWGSPSCS